MQAALPPFNGHSRRRTKGNASNCHDRTTDRNTSVADTPATGQDAATDSDEIRTLRREMVIALVNDGTLTDDRWRHPFLAVPRHVMVPNFYQSSKHVDGQADAASGRTGGRASW